MIGSETGESIHFSSSLPWCATLVSTNRDLVFDYFQLMVCDIRLS